MSTLRPDLLREAALEPGREAPPLGLDLVRLDHRPQVLVGVPGRLPREAHLGHRAVGGGGAAGQGRRQAEPEDQREGERGAGGGHADPVVRGGAARNVARPTARASPRERPGRLRGGGRAPAGNRVGGKGTRCAIGCRLRGTGGRPPATLLPGVARSPPAHVSCPEDARPDPGRDGDRRRAQGQRGARLPDAREAGDQDRPGDDRAGLLRRSPGHQGPLPAVPAPVRRPLPHEDPPARSPTWSPRRSSRTSAWCRSRSRRGS